MLHFIMVACLTAFVANAPLFAQQTEDVVYLKNGDIVWGTIVEQIPSESLKIQTADGSVFVYAMNEISRIVRESAMGTEEAATGIEIGTLFGLSFLAGDDDSATFFGVPGGLSGSTGNPSLYMLWFPNKKLAIGPEFGFGRFSMHLKEEYEEEYEEGEFSVTFLYLGGRGTFFLQSNAMSGTYITGHGALSHIGSDLGASDSETAFSIGAGLGYQWGLGSALILRTEGRYRYWFDVDGEQLNDFSFLLGLGTRAGRVGRENNTSAPEVEIGTLFGLSHRLVESDSGIATATLTHIGVPAALPPVRVGFSFPYIPSLYLLWFPSEKLAIGPEFSFGRSSSNGDGITSLYLGGRSAFFLQSNSMSSPYIMGHGALLFIDSDAESETDFSAGAGLGYQWRLGSALVLRAEGQYRRWFNEEINDLSLIIGLGTRLGGR